jgi:uncharacterized membrane protein/predicted DsbA family dithiol-disulfide isomerase
MITRLLALVGFTVSAVLLGSALRPGERSCPFDVGCDAVLHSSYGIFLGVPLPILGVGVFGALFVLSLFQNGRKQQVSKLLGIGAGAGAVALLGIQLFRIGQVCPFCVIADASAILIALCEIALHRGAVNLMIDWRTQTLWLGVAAIALVFGVGLGLLSRGGVDISVPAEVRSHWIEGKINVVEVSDFECPHCREMQAIMQRFLKKEGDRVHFVRLVAPMPKHPHARDAARAFLCAEQQGQGQEMADALFASPTLDAAACQQIARDLGLFMESYRACLADPATDERLDAVVAWSTRVSPKGLPVTWVGDRVFFGVHELEELEKAARQAEQRLTEAGH